MHFRRDRSPRSMSSVDPSFGTGGAAADASESSEIDEIARETSRAARRIGSAAAGFVTSTRQADTDRERWTARYEELKAKHRGTPPAAEVDYFVRNGRTWATD